MLQPCNCVILYNITYTNDCMALKFFYSTGNCNTNATACMCLFYRTTQVANATGEIHVATFKTYILQDNTDY